jgi:hypothetical protein
VKRHLVVLVGLAAILATAGCGGGSGGGAAGESRLSKQEYERDVQSIAKAARASELNSLHGSAHPSLAQYGLALSKAMSEAAGRLGRLRPPADAAEDNTKIVAGFSYAARAMRDAPTKVTSLKAAQAYEANFRKLLRSAPLRAMATAVADLEKKGYDLGALSGSASLGQR